MQATLFFLSVVQEKKTWPQCLGYKCCVGVSYYV